MKPAWAHRETDCDRCGKTIEPQEKRLDDTVRRGETIFRLHYHVKCYFEYIDDYFENNPYKPTPGVGGRPALDLTDEQRTERRLVLGRLHSLKQYYIPLLDFNTDIDKLSSRDLKRFQRFHQKRKEFLEQLEALGGVPETYQGSTTPTLSDMGTQNSASVVTGT